MAASEVPDGQTYELLARFASTLRGNLTEHLANIGFTYSNCRCLCVHSSFSISYVSLK